MNSYPTKKEILKDVEKQPVRNSTINIVEKWKNIHYKRKWRNLEQEQKKIALEELIELLWTSSHPTKEKPQIRWKKDVWKYSPDKHIITGANPSIISTLHELGHAIHGESELKACIYSTSIFKTCFPIEYGRLKWHGHMLLKN